MNQYNEISTLQYMGSKTRIISHICEPIIKKSAGFKLFSANPAPSIIILKVYD